MFKKLNEEESKKLVEMVNSVDDDLAKFPFIKTTEDFFKWREDVKQCNNNDGAIRNQVVEDIIEGNKSMELVYAWSKFSRMIDSGNARIGRLKDISKEDRADYDLNPAILLHSYLRKNGKGNTRNLFGIFQVPGLNLGLRHHFRTFNTPYEFEKALVTDDVSRISWPVDLLVIMLNAYDVNGEDLVNIGREFESLTIKYNSEKGFTKTSEGKVQKVYTKK